MSDDINAIFFFFVRVLLIPISITSLRYFLLEPWLKDNNGALGYFRCKLMNIKGNKSIPGCK